MENILSKYIDTEIGVSFSSGKVDAATLKSFNSGFIVIQSKETVQHIPFHSVVRFIEAGDEAYFLLRKRSHPLTIVVTPVISVVSTY
ncbi:hypothetical protein [Candidatus Pantoea floridensis]|uniref:Uncharacterized protein n=1 Tax=Candidatus Pantoea floridensis TaxID=1938870 RepID=A0A286DST7_9GAMM|nr:hypothetical protein [Pantoea floridensis]PIF06762.1 hypothetical protein BX596_5253 [Enterobacteriaceae bacterium JKS000233]SOD61705.1 hypothetical protein SAMN06273570_5258 [Pantoea floridensis]